MFAQLLFPVSSIAQVQAHACAIQADGKIVAGGIEVVNTADQLVLARYLTDGTFDTSFGTTGVVATAVGSDAQIHALAIQADGKIVVAGFAMVSGVTQVMVARYATNGSLDTSFGASLTGIVTTVVGDGAVATAVAVQSDNKIVVAGVAIVDGTPEFVIIRYNSDGSADTSFGASGIVTTQIGVRAKGYSVAIQPSDGNIVVAGFAVVASQDQFAVARYNSADGSLDTTFNSGGTLPGTITTAIGSTAHAHSVAIQADGKIVVAGDSDTSCALARYTTAGVLDTTFGTSGIVTTVQGSQAGINGIALQTDGKIVATGFSDNLFILFRYLDTGALDTSFNTTGKVTILVEDVNIGHCVLVQSDGNIVAAGCTDDDFIVVRYTTTGTPDVSWGINGVVTQPSGNENVVTKIWEQQSTGTNAGTFTSGIWQTRILNQLTSTSSGYISLASNQITLNTGFYQVHVTAPAYKVGNHQIRLQNITNGITTAWGSSAFASPTGSVTNSYLDVQLSLGSPTTFEVQHMCAITEANDGLGIAAGFGAAEIYTNVTITPLVN